MIRLAALKDESDSTVFQQKLQICLIFWNIRGHCTIKSFRTQNFLISLKTVVFFQANLQKWQIVECAT